VRSGIRCVEKLRDQNITLPYFKSKAKIRVCHLHEHEPASSSNIQLVYHFLTSKSSHLVLLKLL